MDCVINFRKIISFLGEVLRTTSVTSTAASTISEAADKPTPVLATVATQAITPTTCSVSQAVSVTSTASITTTVPAITVPAAPKTTVKLKVGFFHEIF